ncbi:hypothetical protein ACFXTN_012326 [Malus domestica]
MEMDTVVPLFGRLDGLGAMETCGKGTSFLAVANPCSSSSIITSSTLFGADLDGGGAVPTCFPLLNMIALADSKPPFGFAMVELGNLPCSRNCPMNSAICPTCFSNSSTFLSLFCIPCAIEVSKLKI